MSVINVPTELDLFNQRMAIKGCGGVWTGAQIVADVPKYYSKGIGTGLAIAIEILEECETVAQAIYQIRQRMLHGKP